MADDRPEAGGLAKSGELEGDDFETLTVIEALPGYFQRAGA